MKIDTLAAIDIGSNAIRMLISNIEQYPRDRKFKKLAFIRIPIRLGEDVFTGGCISQDKSTRLIETMRGFSHIIKAFNVLAYRACATSAMREASNARHITQSILHHSGINVEIISGKEEAETIYRAGGLNSVMSPEKNYIYVDVGGGSTEVVVYSEGCAVQARSFSLGTVRILVGAVDQNDKTEFKAWLKGVYRQYSPQGIIASGGNINKLHKMLGKLYPETITTVELRVLYEQLKDMSLEDRVHNMGLNTYRADVIVPALKIFITSAKICHINEIIVPRVGLVDGIIHSLYSELDYRAKLS